MPLFRNTWNDQPTREPEPLPPTPPPRRRTGLFRSRRSADDSPTRRVDTYTNGNTRHSPTTSSSGGFFSRRRSSDDSSDRPFGRSGREESSISAARQKVADAENAERLAGDALRKARIALREARGQVRILENEAFEDARRAKLKQKEAKAVGKSMKHLGRYGQ